MHFDRLKKGSCFCIYSAFHEESKSRFEYRAYTDVGIEFIRTDDFLALEKDNLDISDELKSVRLKIEHNEKSEFDTVRCLNKEENKEL